MLRSIPGLENVTMTRAGYAVEYDFVDPKQLFPTLETKKVRVRVGVQTLLREDV